MQHAATPFRAYGRRLQQAIDDTFQNRKEAARALSVKRGEVVNGVLFEHDMIVKVDTLSNWVRGKTLAPMLFFWVVSVVCNKDFYWLCVGISGGSHRVKDEQSVYADKATTMSVEKFLRVIENAGQHKNGEQSFRGLFELPIPMILVSLNLTIIEINDAYRVGSGLSVDDCVDRKLHDVLNKEVWDAVLPLYVSVLHDNEVTCTATYHGVMHNNKFDAQEYLLAIVPNKLHGDLKSVILVFIEKDKLRQMF